MKKKLLALLLCVVIVAAVVFVLVACTDEDSIVVWVGEGTKELTEQQIAKFNKTNEWNIEIKAKVEEVSESKAVGDAASKPKSAADIFCFAQDQLARAVRSNLLAPLTNSATAAIEENCDDGSIEAAKIGGTIRAFPMTADNGYYMYYDKRVITSDVDVTSLEALIEACVAAGKNFSMNLTEDGGGWYAASFFYATGCESTWTTDTDGNFIDYVDTFNTPAGLIALKGMKKLIDSSCYHSSDKVADFSAGIASAVVVSGIWDYNAAKTALGSNLGVAALPSFEVDGQPYTLQSYLGHKLMGIKPQEDPYKALDLQRLAMYLTSEECQLERFNKVGWVPSIQNLQEGENKVTSEAMDVLLSAKTVLQGQYPSNWWNKMEAMTVGAKSSTTDAALNALLKTYSDALPALKVEQD